MSTKKPTERALALQALLEVVDEKQSLSHLKTPLTPFSKALCFGVCRYYFKLSAIADYLLKKPVKKTKVHLVLLLGLYQLDALDLPEYAVLNETVSLLNAPKLAWAKSLVNAILRRYCREKNAIHSALLKNNAYCYAHPKWLLNTIQHAWPNDWKSITQANNAHPPMSLRVNHQKSTRDAYLNTLTACSIQATPLKHSTHGLTLEKPVDVHALPGFDTGSVSVQDGAAQLAAQLLMLKPNLRVLDACAAPGGKTCHILEIEPQLSTLVALDIDAKRILKIQENLTRLGLKAACLASDAEKTNRWWDGTLFDRILLDAPCSATGVIRRHPDIKLLRTPKDITDVTKTQRRLLEALWPLLAPGGILVYATCSILPEENELQIAMFNKAHANCAVSSNVQPFGHATGHGTQILPGEDGMDGFFYSVLTKQHL
ncbi:MAG: 16S rRNA (cytosine(967)-C(5))-methyltransferase RsmB [Legionellaceae bacterium]|nr:16S rRNA (cytosine(967)-C(5))-methyltransferase RsmB [Legionellaceae bacterium]